MITLSQLRAVALGAIVGALSRYYLTELVRLLFGKKWIFGATLVINFTGCILIALILTLAAERLKRMSLERRLLLTTGFCGAYTTFAGYELEVQNFLNHANLQWAFNYWFGSIVAGLLGIYLGIKIARGVTGKYPEV
jgi:fluoride exporter